LISGEATPDVRVIEQVTQADLAQAVRREIEHLLATEDFQILYWYYVEKTHLSAEGSQTNWTDKAIGAALGLPLNTVTSRRLRALERLRKNERLQRLFLDLDSS
jgi:hypothetical protein